MTKIAIVFILCFSFLNAKIEIGENFQSIKLKDQFDKIHQINKDTKNIIFTFKKSTGCQVKEFFSTLEKKFLSKRNALFVMDISKVPSILKFIVLSDLKKYKYPIVLLEDEKLNKNYITSENIDKIMLIKLDNLEIKDIKYFKTAIKLKEALN